MWLASFSLLKGSDKFEQEVLKHYMETNPEGTVQTYIFLVDNQDIALNIVMSGYLALCLVQEDDGYYFSADSFIEEMRAIQFTGRCQCAYHYVASCTVKWVNDKLLTFFKDAGLDGKAGWQLLKEKEYLGKLDNQKEVEKLLEQYILRFERNPKEEPELSHFHLFDAKGNVKGVRDMEIVDYLVENVQFFVVGITPYYEHGVFLEDHDGVRMKYRIQKLVYRDQVQSGVIKRIYNLLITHPKVYREAYELNKQPVRWINFKNGYYDPVMGEMLEHNPDYLTINQIPFPYYPEDCEQVLQGGENIKKYLASSLPNKEEQQIAEKNESREAVPRTGVEANTVVKDAGKAERKAITEKKTMIGKEKKLSIHEHLKKYVQLWA